MRKTMRNIEKIVGKKERAAWRELHFQEKEHGKDSIQYQKALSEWAALLSVKYLFESQKVFDSAWQACMND